MTAETSLASTGRVVHWAPRHLFHNLALYTSMSIAYGTPVEEIEVTMAKTKGPLGIHVRRLLGIQP